MPDIHCRACDATFFRPLSPHRGMVCPQCHSTGELVTADAERALQVATLQRRPPPAPRSRRPTTPSKGAAHR